MTCFCFCLAGKTGFCSLLVPYAMLMLLAASQWVATSGSLQGALKKKEIRSDVYLADSH
jgi:hypothetical protein